MGKTTKLTTDKFIEKARNIHGDKYDYSKVKYINNRTKVCIICPEHGEFWQTPSSHISLKRHRGCPKCGGTRKLTREEFILKARQIHGWKYDYSKVEYINLKTKVCIICPKHGEFWQTPSSHLSGEGCNLCGIETTNVKNSYTKKQFIEKSKNIHGNKYDYSKVEYNKSNRKICIICPKHGEFWQTPSSHIYGIGCPMCGKEKKAKSLTLKDETFFKKCQEKGITNKITFLEKYTKSKNKIKCQCVKCENIWYSTPNVILRGCGCPKCNHFGGKQENNLYEQLLDIFNQETIIQKYKEKSILGKQEIDIFFPDYNIGIEYQGAQHFIPVEIMGGEKELEKQIQRDIKKYEITKENNIKLLYFLPSTFRKNNINIYHHKNSYIHLERLINRIKKEIKKAKAEKKAKRQYK